MAIKRSDVLDRFVKFAVEIKRERWHYVLRVPIAYPRQRLLADIRSITKHKCKEKIFVLMQFLVEMNKKGITSPVEMLPRWNARVNRRWRFSNTRSGLTMFTQNIHRARELLRIFDVEAQLQAANNQKAKRRRKARTVTA